MENFELKSVYQGDVCGNFILEWYLYPALTFGAEIFCLGVLSEDNSLPC